MPDIIHTPRLDIIPMTPAFLRASLAGDLVEASRLLEINVPAFWPIHSWVLALRLQQLEDDPTLQPWLLRAMVVRDTRQFIGQMGFHGKPGAECLQQRSPGAAEFGFDVFPEFRRQGYAYEAARGMIRWAFAQHGVRSFVFSISPENAASQGLAAKLGYVRVGSHMDERDGPEDILLRSVDEDDELVR